MREPPYIKAAGINTQNLSYDWDLDVSRAITAPLEDEHPRITKPLFLINDVAAFGVLAATAQWVVWRFDGIVDIADGIKRIEACFASVVDARYATIPSPDEPFPEEKQDAHGPLMLARMLMSDAQADHAAGHPTLTEWALSMILLAQLIVPNKDALEKWLSGVLRRCAQHYPRGAAAGAKPPPPASFFDPGFSVTDDAMRKELDGFLSSLKQASNPYLRVPDEMLKLGFKGTPYRYP